MKTKNNQPQPSKATFVLPLAKAWWKRNPQANLLDIESAIQKIAEAPAPNGKQSHDKKGNSRR